MEVVQFMLGECAKGVCGFPELGWGGAYSRRSYLLQFLAVWFMDPLDPNPLGMVKRIPGIQPAKWGWGLEPVAIHSSLFFRVPNSKTSSPLRKIRHRCWSLATSGLSKQPNAKNLPLAREL